MKKIYRLRNVTLSIVVFFGLVFIASPSAFASDGLAGYWTFDEATGNTYADSSGNGNTGTITGTGVTHSTDVPPITCFADPYSVSFDGSGGYVSVPDSVTMDPANQITVSFWMNANTVTNGYQQIIFKKGPVYTSYGVWLANNQVYMETDDNNGIYSLTSNATITPGTWNYITVTYDGTTQDLYINGVLDSSQSLSNITIQYNASPLMIGSGTYNNPFSGYVDDLRIYDTALTASQVADLAGGGCGPGVNPTVQPPTTTTSSTSTNNSSEDPTSTSKTPDTGYGQPHSVNPLVTALFAVSVVSVTLGSLILLKRRRN